MSGSTSTRSSSSRLMWSPGRGRSREARRGEALLEAVLGVGGWGSGIVLVLVLDPSPRPRPRSSGHARPRPPGRGWDLRRSRVGAQRAHHHSRQPRRGSGPGLRAIGASCAEIGRSESDRVAGIGPDLSACCPDGRRPPGHESPHVLCAKRAGRKGTAEPSPTSPKRSASIQRTLRPVSCEALPAITSASPTRPSLTSLK